MKPTPSDTVRLGGRDDRELPYWQVFAEMPMDESLSWECAARGYGFVGPRPERRSLWSGYKEILLSVTHVVRPGITGWRQVRSLRQYRRDAKDKVAVRSVYIKKCPGLDFLVISRPSRVLFAGRTMRWCSGSPRPVMYSYLDNRVALLRSAGGPAVGEAH